MNYNTSSFSKKSPAFNFQPHEPILLDRLKNRRKKGSLKSKVTFIYGWPFLQVMPVTSTPCHTIELLEFNFHVKYLRANFFFEGVYVIILYLIKGLHFHSRKIYHNFLLNLIFFKSFNSMLISTFLYI